MLNFSELKEWEGVVWSLCDYICLENVWFFLTYKVKDGERRRQKERGRIKKGSRYKKEAERCRGKNGGRGRYGGGGVWSVPGK